MAAGIVAGDVILAVDGRAVSAFSELRDIVGASDGKPLLLDVWRAGETFEADADPTPRGSAAGRTAVSRPAG